MITKPIVPIYIVLPALIIILGIYVWGMIQKKNKTFYKVLGIARILAILTLAFLINLRIMEKEYNAEVEM